jgi:hypothetical protein
MNNQKGVIPILLILALALSAALGGMLGFQLGDGSLMGFGIGFGLVFFAIVLLGPQIKKFLNIKDSIEKK